MVIAVTGATGLIGKKLTGTLKAEGHTITAIRRTGAGGHDSADLLLRQIPENTDAVIHLAGAPVFGKRWSDAYKKEILESRVNYTRNIVAAIARMETKPDAFICSSAVGYYGQSRDETFTEEAAAGNDFLSEVSKAWEYEASKAEEYGVRRVSLRTGIVLGKEGGALKNIITPFKFFAGGCPGDGDQWFPWIHIDDMVNIIKFVLTNKQISGPVNACSPNAVKMKEMTREVGKAMHRPAFFNVPGFIFKLLYGQGASAILEGQRVMPRKLLDAGYEFSYPEINAAMKDLI